jgi:hypothetical protein
MTSATSKSTRQRDPIVALMLNGGRVTSTFRTALFDAAQRQGMSANEFVLMACAERLKASGREFSGVFRPGDLKTPMSKGG